MTEPQFTLRVPAEVAAVPRLLDALEAFAAETGLGARATHRLALVCEELVANVAMHGARGSDGATYAAVAIRRTVDSLRVTIEDDGGPFDPLSVDAPDTAARLETRDAGGLGVHVVRAMAREVDYAREGGLNRLTLVLDATG